VAVALAACGSGASGSPSATTSATTSAAGSDAASGPTIAVTGKDYAFEGIPSDVSAGSELTFKNVATDEDHGLVGVRKNDDATKELEDLLKNGTEEEQQSMTTQIGALEARPGQSAQGTIKLDQPGGCLALCPVPVGSMTGPASDAMPHFMKGMYTLFTVK
jgi:plastocyanin